MLAIFKRELNAYFTAPLGYVFITICILTSGIFFYLFTLSTGTADLSGVFTFMFYVLMIFVPILTMRLMSEEKRQKTDQLILTAPISLFKIVIGKFLSAYLILLIGTIAMPIYGVVLSFFTTVSWPTIIGNYVGIALLGGVYVSLGLLISTFTENQMIAAVISIFVNVGLFLMSVLSSAIQVDFISNIIVKLSIFNRYAEFTQGIFGFSNVLFFVSAIFIFLFVTVRVMDKRRWG